MREQPVRRTARTSIAKGKLSAKRSQKRKRMSSHDVYTTLKEMILSFELYPGSRVTEAELAERFKVSRTPVREALQRLETEGNLTIRPKQGCFIRELDIVDLTQHYQVRIELEMLSLKLACTNMPDRDLLELAEEWNPEEQKGRSELPTQMDVREESYHMALATGGGNTALCRYMEDINNHIRIVRRLDFTNAERIDRTYQEHYDIVQHLLRRDLKAAQRLMREHITRSMEYAKTLTLMELARRRPR